MSAQTAIAILDSMFDLFKEMGSGIALDLNWLAIARRLQQVRAQAVWSADLDFVATKLKAHAAHYAATYRPPLGSEAISKANADRLDDVVRHYSILRAHLEQQLPAS
ncbi:MULTISPECIES: hypothetical protein [Methylobacterium]|jgi:hypothetical protein|uniref:Protein of unassigned function n=2 Tax=Methylobacterium TaxID=407 RepID=A0A089NRM8_9HYPH|nr:MULTISPECIES: hypothetical protein [Methylobacterium]AIQ89195.1 protein of unassigned function [Methylobacterium oryzae CBMB20]AWV18300.1 hypothetical protein A3862_24585 [Methylobacterium sp. XJLW]MBA9065514.1 hypothetical protein [Methylobacterium fujisawaense]MBP32085.1 hypothetical protein [Methylobacterium sp.]MDE4915326.1 hypothetical protein [Methylobacterium sp. 092160098-2]